MQYSKLERGIKCVKFCVLFWIISIQAMHIEFKLLMPQLHSEEIKRRNATVFSTVFNCFQLFSTVFNFIQWLFFHFCGDWFDNRLNANRNNNYEKKLHSQFCTARWLFIPYCKPINLHPLNRQIYKVPSVMQRHD